ncbi:MAG: rod-binding protein [Gammaproteobacteria bacterium]|nr:rod-binding protein [Pseudomonadales bacterium]MCP5349021.1 rod-binding protein [Pseudomonadales bacterium]
MTTAADVYTDFSGLASLRLQASSEPTAAVKEVARQFESLFVGMMLKAMRDAVPRDGLFASSQLDNYQDMFDKQLALDLSRQGGIGLADLIEQQIAATVSFTELENNEPATIPGDSRP